MITVELTLKHKTLKIDIPQGVVADPALLDGGHPLYYAIKNRRQTENYLNQVYDLLKDLPKHMDILEFCGGIGLVARSLWDRLEPASWTAIELDAACEPLFGPKEAKFVLKDMYDPTIQPMHDLVICEFSNNTIPKMWREPKRVDLLRRIAATKPRFWYIADVGYYWIHLANHWPLYQVVFGVKPTRENYHELFNRFMIENHGYKVTNWTVGGGAQYFLLEAV